MSNKKNNIIQSASHLFAEYTYDAVSTKKIAATAQVSEGLIFKHFKNKKALLDSVLLSGEKKLTAIYHPITEENDPKVVLRKTIEIPFEILASDFDLWKLHLKQKWQDDKKTKQNDILFNKLLWAFERLSYKEPDKEAGLLIMILESITANIILEGKPSQLKYKYFLIHRYTL